MDELSATLESHITFRDKGTGRIVAIEHQNGKLERYHCEDMTNKQSQELFGISRMSA